MPSSAPPTEPLARARDLLDRTGHVHLAGVGGIGMAGLAFHLQRRGLRVSGCDAADGPLLAWLRARGIPATVGHDPAHAAGPDWFIRSAAVPADEPELEAARARGLTILRRGEVLPALLAGFPSAVVAGSHGKTSTASFLTLLLQHAGRAPSFCIGGRLPPAGDVAGAGAPGAPFVAEGDESDGTLALYAPDLAIVTNIEFDHMEHFDGPAAFEACFAAFMARTRRRLLFCADDPRAARLAAGHPLGAGYGFGPAAFYRAVDPVEAAGAIRFTLVRGGEPLGPVDAPVPGRHNILNTLAATAAALELGLDFDAVRAAARTLALPRRRFERVVDRPDLLVISDYGHHPSEVRAVLQTARGLGRRIRAVFQPHRYTRTRALGAEFPPAFEGVADLVLAPVYAASEPPLEGGAIADLYRRFRENGQTPRLARSLHEAWLDLRARLAPGDLLLVIGAGSVDRIADWARAEFAAPAPLPWRDEPLESVLREPLPDSTVARDAPLGIKTTFGVGGSADAWIEAGSESDLAALLARARRAGVPVLPVGAGGNLLIPDSGLRGIALRLAPAAFGAIRREGDRLIAGGAVSAGRLLDAAQQAGLGGLEFLEGIPGRVGGLLRMNAGAFGGAIGPRVRTVRVAEPDGTIRDLDARELDFPYRACPALAGHVVVQAEFTLEPRAEGAIRAARATVAARREWMRGLRCAGSVFKNPPGPLGAGALLEAAGMKGVSVGGATVSTRHANVITAGPGACASDVLALLQLAQAAVERRSGIRLEPELVIPEPNSPKLPA